MCTGQEHWAGQEERTVCACKPEACVLGEIISGAHLQVVKAPEHQIVQGHLSNLMRQSFVDHVALSFQECPSSLLPPPIRVYGHFWIHWLMGQVPSLAYATTISSLVTNLLLVFRLLAEIL